MIDDHKEHKEVFKIFQDALNFLTLELAKMIVWDGEGVTRFVTLNIRGARSSRDAEAAARAIANSSLVKTSWCGGDPNWGRIIDALGYSSAQVVENKVDIGYSAPESRSILWSLKRGQPTKVGTTDAVPAALSRPGDIDGGRALPDQPLVTDLAASELQLPNQAPEACVRIQSAAES